MCGDEIQQRESDSQRTFEESESAGVGVEREAVQSTGEDEVGWHDERAARKHRHVAGAVVVACRCDVQHLKQHGV